MRIDPGLMRTLLLALAVVAMVTPSAAAYHTDPNTYVDYLFDLSGCTANANACVGGGLNYVILCVLRVHFCMDEDDWEHLLFYNNA